MADSSRQKRNTLGIRLKFSSTPKKAAGKIQDLTQEPACKNSPGPKNALILGKKGIAWKKKLRLSSGPRQWE
jgi:hypothetical protein